METNLTRAIYDRAPSVVRNFAASIFGWVKNRRRRRGDYHRWLSEFNGKRHWTNEQLSVFQNQKLRVQIKQAIENVPYYTSLFKRLGLEISDIQSVDDLKKLPILEKESIVSAGHTLISNKWSPDKLNWYPTSGSTGTPLLVPRAGYIEQMEWAFLDARYFGLEIIGKPYSSFTGLELLPASQEKAPFWIDNWASKQRMFSVFHISKKNIPAYIKALNDRYSLYYLGYPSAVYSIAKYMVDNAIVLDKPPKYFFSGSEELLPQYAETIQRAFGCEVRNRYGQNEFVGSITMRDCGHLHYDMDYSILEFIPTGKQEDGLILAEIIATNIHDVVWPLLRYRTGDLVAIDPVERCTKGYPGQIIRRIHGRTGHYFTLPNGSRVTNISVIAKKCTNVKFMQVRQRKLDSLDICVVKDANYSKVDENNLIRQFRRKLGDEIKLNIVYVVDIKRTPSGKYISILNEVGSA